ncbi:LiaI-LiaF-like domain-containing protein [Fibrella aquatica]|uniref:LiaI-LiaF-like domain-containing protein n=1 Tax=Fibrella aquatica TaxID=3242487 RepID=UPI00352106A6
MNTQRNLFWGLTCITLGVLFLARNWNLFPMPDWHFVRTLWPVLLILGGIALILKNSTPVMSVLATGVLAVALPFWLFSYLGRNRHYNRDRDISMHFNMPDPPSPPGPPSPPDAPNPPSMDMDFDDDDDNDDDNDHSYSRNLTTGSFSEDMAPAPAEARFVLEGGAAKFKMKETTSRLIDARTKAVNVYSMSIDKAGSKPGVQVPTIRLSPAKGSDSNINLFDDDNHSNFGEVVVKLNETPLWDMQMDFGAGAADFDLSRYAVKTLKIEAGAASLDLKLGEKAAQSDVRISSGMAAVKIRVPKDAGVKLTTDGGLNSTDIDDDFEKVGNSTYLSPNYNTSTKKITIRYDGGLSSLRVSRY